MMRISKDPADKAFCSTPEQYNVFYRDKAVVDWFTADMVRRVVIKEDGTVMNGDCLISKVTTAPTDLPADVGFAGAGMVAPPKPAPAPEPTSEVPVQATWSFDELQQVVSTTSPGLPDDSVVVTQSERLPDEGTQD